MSERTIFVFGSNLAGRHGAGSALHAKRQFGAETGVGEGLTGNAYAIPTKDFYLRVMSLEDIAYNAKQFKQFAREHPTWRFELVAIGCGLAGYRPEQIAPLFADAPDNVSQPPEFTAARPAAAPPAATAPQSGVGEEA